MATVTYDKCQKQVPAVFGGYFRTAGGMLTDPVMGLCESCCTEAGYEIPTNLRHFNGKPSIISAFQPVTPPVEVVRTPVREQQVQQYEQLETRRKILST